MKVSGFSFSDAKSSPEPGLICGPEMG